jgi:galactonate dehydratase
MITRRDFVKLTGAGALPLITVPEIVAGHKFYTPSNHPAGPVIKNFTIFDSTGSFYRFIGMNAYDRAPKGINKTRKSFIIELSDGTIGIGPVGYRRIDNEVISKVKQLIGKDPFTFYQWENDKIVGVSPAMHEYFFDAQYSWIESAILDVIGKQKDLPVWKLMGDSVREGIDPYDGTMYFEDIAYNTDVSIISEIGKRIKADGYQAIKIKLGRPSKWLPGEAGVNRDIEAFIALREAVGQNFNLMADANNGYKDRFDWALKLLTSCAPYDMYYMEELFPEDTAQYLELRKALLKENFFIPIAEGENIHELEKFESYLKDGVYNYIQPDMPTCGFSYILKTAKEAEKYPHAKLIPHVWQSQLGLIMGLHASKIQPNINYVEDSRYLEHAFNTSGYLFKNGQWLIPDKPGWGVDLSPDYKQYVTGEEVKIS